ncbi:MAG: ABC transporter ATP-binding protein [Bacteroidales bacterium]|nr:ABC transporter ATP-binding protein [Bacteroidales bacterium]
MSVIKCKDVCKIYKDSKTFALDNLSLEVEAHTVFGFLGPNGAGKTTTVKILTGLMKPSSGEAWVCGENVKRNSMALRQKIGYLGQELAMYKWMKGRELLLFVGDIFGLSRKENLKRADYLLEMSGLTQSANKKITSFSGGMKQRLGIAQALVSKPQVLFLDEPTSALDPIGRKEVLEFIQGIKNETTVFMSTHILADVERVCDDVAILNNGRLLAMESLSHLKNRYASDKCEIEFETGSSTELFETALKNQSRFNFTRNNFLFSVSLNVVEKDYAGLLNLLCALNLTAKRIEITGASLEDIFVKLIKHD